MVVAEYAKALTTMTMELPCVTPEPKLAVLPSLALIADWTTVIDISISVSSTINKLFASKVKDYINHLAIGKEPDLSVLRLVKSRNHELR
jgi:hypothetical protein